MLKRISILLLSLLCLTACSKSEDSSSTSVTSTSSQNVIHENSTGDRTYSFPEFLSDSSDADVLSNVVYTSFDLGELLVEPEKQPFEDYKCTACFDGQYYIYANDDNYGLLDANGNILVSADGVEKITPVSPNLLQIDYDSASYYKVENGKGGWFENDFSDFDEERVTFSSNVNESNEVYYTLCLDGESIYDTQWSSVTKLDPDSLDTAKDYELVYSVTSSSIKYYIAFDRFYNFTVYGSECGFISLKADGEYGECYILDNDDYTELQTLISSFGRENNVSAPSKDENEDYISITLGVDDSETTVITVSADGYCMTEETTEENGKNVYFSVMSDETFVDLINWVDTTLSEEFS